MSDPISDEITNTVVSMLKDTADKISKDKGDWEPPKNVAATALTPVYNYSFAILILAENEQKLPAMALLRVLGEFALRLIWCYESTEHGKDATTRIERWYKYSLNERKKSINRWLPIMKTGDPEFAEELEARLQHLQQVMDVIPHKPAPQLAKSIETLHPAAKILLPLIYTRYLHAVHLDAEVLSELVRSKDSGIVFSADEEIHTPLSLKYQCLWTVFVIVSTIWNYFGWDFKDYMFSVFDIAKKCDFQQEINVKGICESIPWKVEDKRRDKENKHKTK
jgi:hypothetical protein